jgi:hypothetical protein
MVLEMSDEEFIAKLREEAGTKDARIKELEERLKAQWSEAAVVAIEKESRASYLPSTLSFAERAELVFFQRGQREAACRILTNEAERRVRELEETLDHIACDHHQLHERIKELEGYVMPTPKGSETGLHSMLTGRMEFSTLALVGERLARRWLKRVADASNP